MSYRIEKLNSLIKEELAKIIEREIEFSRDVLVTVTKVETSIDTTHARAWISVLPENKSSEVLKKLQRTIGVMQGLLNKKLIMRYVPKISFKIDKTAAKIDKFEKIAKEIES
ncbi:MAG: 30S ribosome-binding factor RbfA [Patescibacteria group bacterium]